VHNRHLQPTVACHGASINLEISTRSTLTAVTDYLRMEKA